MSGALLFLSLGKVKSSSFEPYQPPKGPTQALSQTNRTSGSMLLVTHLACICLPFSAFHRSCVGGGEPAGKPRTRTLKARGTSRVGGASHALDRGQGRRRRIPLKPFAAIPAAAADPGKYACVRGILHGGKECVYVCTDMCMYAGMYACGQSCMNVRLYVCTYVCFSVLRICLFV